MMFFENATIAPDPSVRPARTRNESVVKSAGTARHRRPHPPSIQAFARQDDGTFRLRAGRGSGGGRGGSGSGGGGGGGGGGVGLVGALPVDVHRVAEIGRRFVAAGLALRRVVVFSGGHRRRVLV